MPFFFSGGPPAILQPFPVFQCHENVSGASIQRRGYGLVPNIVEYRCVANGVCLEEGLDVLAVMEAY